MNEFCRIVPLLAAAALLFCGCIVSPASQQYQAAAVPNSTNVTPGGVNGSFNLQIEFPPASGISNVSEKIYTTSCAHLLDCVNKYANVSCAWFDAAGALSCSGVSQTCFITAIDNVSPSWFGLGGYWTLLVNGNLSSVGASCLVPQSGQTIQLALTNRPV
jgi:hypothetical protein